MTHDRPRWSSQRPWFEIWFAVVLDEDKRRALWIRQTLFVPKAGEPRASIWGAWFDADATPPSRAAKRREPVSSMKLGDGDTLIRIADCTFGHGGGAGNVDGLAWDATWSGGTPGSGELPAWIPAPTHAHTIVHDADARAKVTVAGANDLTARIVQVLGEGRGRPYDYWAGAKSFAGFLPVGEHVWVPDGGLAAIPELTISTRVNGEERQHASTRELVHDLGGFVRAATSHLGRPLARGDVLVTGTPAGVGLRLSPLRRRVAAIVKDRMRKVDLLVSTYATSSALLRPGDVVEVDAGPAGRVRTRLTV